MGRGKRLFVAVLSAAILTTASAAPMTVLALGDVQVTLSCSDGTETTAAVDAKTLLGLKDAIEAMNLYPAGLSCGLAETPLGGSIGPAVALAADGPKDFAVGGGRFFNQFIQCDENFAMNARAADGTMMPADGTANLSIPGTPAGVCSPAFTGHLVTKVDCVRVTNTSARFTSEVTKSSGIFPTLNIFVGDEIAWEVKDLDPALYDEIFGNDNGVHPANECQFIYSSSQAVFPVLRGQINVVDK